VTTLSIFNYLFAQTVGIYLCLGQFLSHSRLSVYVVIYLATFLNSHFDSNTIERVLLIGLSVIGLFQRKYISGVYVSKVYKEFSD
jgi:hypothetical protein